MQKLRWAGWCFVVTLGCSQSNTPDGVDAAVDTREMPRDGAMEVTRDSLCVGLDPLSQACAREVLARIDRDACQDQLACRPSIDPRYCDVYYPEQGSASILLNDNQLVLVRLGRLRIDLDAALCVLRNNSPCEDTGPALCEPILVPTANFTTCMTQEECGRDGYCSTDRPCGAGRCQPRPASGATCVPGGRCAWGEGCQDGLCRTYTRQRRTAALGARCGLVVEGTTYHYETCAGGLACPFSGTSPQTCVPVASLGESCNNCPGPDCAVCGFSRRCENSVCVSNPLPRQGDPCNRLTSSQGLCDSGTHGLLCEDGLCVTSQGRLGDVCAIPCAEGYCAPPADIRGPSRCMATRLPNGAPCSALDQCENGLCCNGVCVAVPE